MKDKIGKLPNISVSLLNSELSNLKEIVKKIEKAGVYILHLDVMDGNFVPNLTFGPPVIKSLRKYTNCFFDVHLMIKNPFESYISYIKAGSDLLTFHYEAVDKKVIKKLISEIKKNGIFCGISIKPQTPVEKTFSYLQFLDLVLVMTVEPGFGGQKILDYCIKKIRVLNEYRKKRNLKYIISADGGINEMNIKEIINLGCDLPVVGNAIFGDKNYISKIKLFQRLTKQ